jgi:hypothetical protein
MCTAALALSIFNKAQTRQQVATLVGCLQQGFWLHKEVGCQICHVPDLSWASTALCVMDLCDGRKK